MTIKGGVAVFRHKTEESEFNLAVLHIQMRQAKGCQLATARGDARALKQML
jgi:uncharacterized membrane protein YsdA (DUF1294 family)